MNSEFGDFIARIDNNTSIDVERKDSLIEYLKGNLFSNVKVFGYENYQKIEFILEDLGYDKVTFDMLLETTGKIRNEIHGKKTKERAIPNAEYLVTIYNIFKTLNLDIWLYDNGYSGSNVAIARTAYRMTCANGQLCDGTPVLEVTKKIYDSYCSTYNTNKSVCTILKIINRVDKGLSDLGGNYSNVFDSEEFLSLFEHFREMNDLYVSDLVVEFYPVLGNEMFALMKKSFVNSSTESVNKEYVRKYLSGFVAKKSQFANTRAEVIAEIKKIDIKSENDVKVAFEQMLDDFKNNRNVSEEVKEKIISNINGVFEEKYKVQEDFISGEFNSFYNNCRGYIEGISSQAYLSSGVDELIGELLGHCKDFFVEHDSKKFKEIVDYIIENTDITAEELKGVGAKCATIFKEADINKLKSINNKLKEFKTFVNSTNNSFNITDNIFKTILINNPELLLEDNHLDEVLKFLKGDLSLDEYGYRYSNFVIPKDFLSANFYKRIKDDNYKMLIEGNLPRVIHNLNYINEKCDKYGINFTKFNFNDDLLYLIMSHDLYTDGTNLLDNIKEILTPKDFKNILELNPDLFLLSEKDAEVIVERCIFNLNDDYSFYDLFASELYFYRKNDYVNLDLETLVNRAFKYVNLNLDSYPEFSVEDILTSNFISSSDSNELFEVYNDRVRQIEKLNNLLTDLSNADIVDTEKVRNIVDNIFRVYNSVYNQVPNVSYKNKVMDIISSKKEKCELDASDIDEEIEVKKQSISNYSDDRKDSDFAISQIREIIANINSNAVKTDLDNFLTKFKGDRIVKADKKYNEINSNVHELEMKLQVLERQVDHLNYLTSIIDSVDDSNKYVNNEVLDHNSFVIDDLCNRSNKNNEQSIEDVLDGKNVVLFCDDIDLVSIPNDKNFVEKINKFLGDTDRSILSQSFMKNPGIGSLEKFFDHRDGVMSRREDRTPVRVYYIPVRNKYFNCYYVISVNYKDHIHHDGGCSTDEVYKRRMKEVKLLEKKIEKMEYEEVIDFIKENKEKYDEQMKPIVNKAKSYNKK